jgi:hypothetical protein
MRVKDLIAKLAEFEPETEVKLEHDNFFVPIEDVRLLTFQAGAHRYPDRVVIRG